MMVCQYKRRRRPSRREILWIGDGITANKIGPTVPRALTHLKKQVWYISYGSAPTVIRALVNGEHSAIRQEAKRVSISQPPGNELEVTSVEITAHHRCRARQVCRNALSILSRSAKWSKRPRSSPRSYFDV